MRFYNSAVECLNETTRDVFSRGCTVFDKTVQGKIVKDKIYEQKEIIGYSFCLTDFRDLKGMLDWAKMTFGKPHLKAEVADAWFESFFKVENPDKWFEKSEYLLDYWRNFGYEANGKFSYTYGERIKPFLDDLLSRLKHNKDARGAVISVWEPADVSKHNRRVPCTLSYHFIVRQNKLNLFVTQRSCDMVNFLPLDIYKAAMLLDYVAKQIICEVGCLYFNIHSLHAYKKDVPADRQW